MRFPCFSSNPAYAPISATAARVDKRRAKAAAQLAESVAIHEGSARRYAAGTLAHNTEAPSKVPVVQYGYYSTALLLQQLPAYTHYLITGFETRETMIAIPSCCWAGWLGGAS